MNNYFQWAILGLFILFVTIMVVNVILSVYIAGKSSEEKRLMDEMIEFEKQWYEKKNKDN